MKASELISELQKLVAKHGDQGVCLPYSHADKLSLEDDEPDVVQVVNTAVFCDEDGAADFFLLVDQDTEDSMADASELLQ